MTANGSKKLLNPIAHKKLKFKLCMKSQLSKGNIFSQSLNGNIFSQSFFMLTILF